MRKKLLIAYNLFHGLNVLFYAKIFLGPGKCPVTFIIRIFGIKGLVRDQNLLVVSNTVVPVSRVRLPGSS